jgi:catechol 2,3-dioxygenase-like lactoylglutathione lyase family enzyme
MAVDSTAVSDLIDHVGFRVSDLPTSRRMYEVALAELGFSVLGEGEFEGDGYVLFGRGENDDFALHTVGSKPGRDRATTGAHVAFIASDEGSVERWHGAVPPLAMVEPTMALLVLGPSTAVGTSQRSSSIPMAALQH